MENDIEKVLFSEKEIMQKVEELGKQITEDYKDSNKGLVVIGILKGSSIFMSDLIRKINIPLQIDYMVVSSYGTSTESSGVVKIVKDLEESIEDKHVLIVEDIVDTGLTLNYIKEILIGRSPKSVKICSLLDKPVRRKNKVDINYIGFDVPDEFIVGYGIDYAQYYRNLPYIGALKREIYE